MNDSVLVLVPESVLVLVPEVVPTGGVQVFSRHLIAAVRQLVGDARTVVLSRNDRSAPLGDLLGVEEGLTAVGLGQWPRRARAIAMGVTARRLASRVKVGAVVATHPHLAGAAVAAARSAGHGVPTLCVCHGIDVWSVGGAGFRNARTRRGLRVADRLLAVSRFTEQRLAEQLPEVSDRTRVFPNTVDAEQLGADPDVTDEPLRARLDLGDSGPTLLTVARLATSEGPKGYDTVVQALPCLAEQFPNVRYVLAGRGPDANRVQALAESLGVGDRLLLPGFVSDDDLPALYRAADLFVMPSRKEGFGIVFLEAMACGTPVVAGNADGSADAVCDGELGAMVPPGDVDALADAILATLGGRRPEPEEVRRKVIERFGRDAFRRRLADHLRELAPGLQVKDSVPVPAA